VSLDIAALFLLHRNELLSHLQRIVKCRETAHDLIQDSYLILLRASAAQAIEQPRAYLYRTATNLALDHLRHQKIAGRHTVAAGTAEIEHCTASPSAERVAAAGERLERFLSTVESLPELTREIFYRVKIEGLSYRDTARRLGVTERQVERHLLKAMLHCRQATGS